MRRRKNPEIVSGRINSDGSIAGGDGFSVTRNSAGSYTITFQQGFRCVGASGNPLSTGSGVMIHFDPGIFGNLVRAYGFTSVATPAFADIAFTFVAVGVQQ